MIWIPTKNILNKISVLWIRFILMRNRIRGSVSVITDPDLGSEMVPDPV